jgi:ADP-heptose:LPS heptosyltransferase
MDPSAKIIWFVRNEYRQLVDHNPSIDFVLPVHCLTEKNYLKSWCRFDRVFDLHFLDRSCAMCGRQSDQSALKNKEGDEITLRNFYSYGNILQSMSRHSGLPPLNERPNVYITERAISRVDELLLPADFVVFHCSSNTPEKEWPKERWGKLADSISANGCGVVEVGLQPTLNDSGLASYINAAGTLSILETAEIIRRGKIFIGVDSGPAHLANAVGTYGIVLLGSYLGFKKYNPFSGNYGDGSNAALLHVEGAVANIPLERVQQAVDNAFQSQRSMNGW